MQRKTLDLLFSAGGLGLTVLLVIVVFVLHSNADFANGYVTDQLSQQKILFKEADTLTPEERRSDCVVKYAGQLLKTGKQAECYANEFIGLHVKAIPGADGMTYAELGDPQAELRKKVTEAQQSDAAELPTLQKQLADITAARETLFKGETLRGVLLTSYGFSSFGTKADQVAVVLSIVAALLALLSIAGFVHALMTPKSVAFGEPIPS